MPEAIRRMGFVQEDSIDVCGRMHDLILRNRVRDYHPDQLHASLYGPGAGFFEDYLPNLSAVGRENLRWFASRLQARRLQSAGNASDPDECRCLDFLAERGPSRARDFEDDLRRSHSGWGTRRTVTAEVLERLWRQGRIAIAGRVAFHRVFDLAERVYGKDAIWLAEGTSLPDPEECEHALKSLAFRSRPLVRASRSNHAVLRDAGYAPVQIGEDPRVWWASAQIRQTPVQTPVSPQRTRLIAPLDPLIYDRQLTVLLFDFDYRWEVYTPAAKRRRGYYVLPILQRGRIEGWVDLQRDRRTRQLIVRSGLLSPRADAPAAMEALSEFASEIQSELQPNFQFPRSPEF